MNKNYATNMLWGETFSQKPSEAVIRFTAGRDVHSVTASDYTLLPYDIWGSQAHCLMLFHQNIISKKDARVILMGLNEVGNLAQVGTFMLDPEKEDVHTNIESWLSQKYGIESIGKLHTARSRNDQANLDTRLYLKDTVLLSVESLITLQQALIAFGEKYADVVFPGFTHHQHAMVTTFGHILFAFATMIGRDIKKFAHWYDLHNTNPLGNVVSYGTTFPIDQAYTSKLLGFDGMEINSLDQITNRWEPEADLACAIVSMMNHLSGLAQTLILLCTPEFSMLKLADAFSTGSSIMPQKKNPDPLEVMKGKASYAQGQLMSLLSLGKANFIGYNRDSQWTKYIIMDLVNETSPAPTVMQGILRTMVVNKEVMEQWCHKGFIGATTLLEQITANFGIPFRQAKVVVEKAVKYSQGQDKVNYGAILKGLQEENIDIKITRKQVRLWQDPKTILELTKSVGGPGNDSFIQSGKFLRKQLESHNAWLKEKFAEKEKALRFLKQEIQILLDGGELHG